MAYAKIKSKDAVIQKLGDESVESLLVRECHIYRTGKKDIIRERQLNTMKVRDEQKREVLERIDRLKGLMKNPAFSFTFRYETYLKTYAVNTKLSLFVLEFHEMNVTSDGEVYVDEITEYEWIE